MFFSGKDDIIPNTFFYNKVTYHIFYLLSSPFCIVQCALLYTTIDGQRRIRVSTLSLPCTTILSNLFRSADLDTQFACFLKQGTRSISVSVAHADLKFILH